MAIGTVCTRWRTGQRLARGGLPRGLNAFISARIRAVAATVGAPQDESPACKSNVQILFTLEPQQVLDAVAKQDSLLLGFHYAQQEKRLATVSRPIQGWYVTSTRNYRGQEAIDNPMPLGTQQGSSGAPPGYFPGSKVPPGEPGSRLTNLRSSQIVLALIVVDAKKIAGMAVGPLADYIAMLALSQAKSPDTCSQLPSIVDLMASDRLRQAEKVAQITAGDLAFLRALYSINLETPLPLESAPSKTR